MSEEFIKFITLIYACKYPSITDISEEKVTHLYGTDYYFQSMCDEIYNTVAIDVKNEIIDGMK